MTDRIAAARALLTEATPGPWEVGFRSIVVANLNTVGEAPYIGSTSKDNLSSPEAWANAHLVALARNAFPTALDLANAVEVEHWAYHVPASGDPELDSCEFVCCNVLAAFLTSIEEGTRDK